MEFSQFEHSHNNAATGSALTRDFSSWLERSAILQGCSQPEFVASGSHGTVYRVKKHGREYALKAIDCGANPEKARNAHQELSLMQKITCCKNVVPLVDSEVLRDGDRTVVFILEPFMTSFEEYCKSHSMPIDSVLQLGIDICTALETCWASGVAHLDIQPKNLFVDHNGCFCLGDFSSAMPVIALNEEHRLHGTLSYMAPEVYGDQKYSQASETYSLGMVLYCLLNHGNLPFMKKGSKQDAVMTRLIQNVPVPSLYLGIELDLLLQRALAVDIRERYPDFQSMRNALMLVREKLFYPAGSLSYISSAPVAATDCMLFDSDSFRIHLRSGCTTSMRRSFRFLPRSRCCCRCDV